MPSNAAYRQRIDQVAAGLKGRAAAIVLEPDVLALMTTCLTEAQQADTYASMAYAGKALKAASSRAKVYFDAGHSAWLSASDMAARLVRADIARSADGISLNVSNYRTNTELIPYARSVIAAAGAPGLKAVRVHRQPVVHGLHRGQISICERWAFDMRRRNVRLAAPRRATGDGMSRLPEQRQVLAVRCVLLVVPRIRFPSAVSRARTPAAPLSDLRSRNAESCGRSTLETLRT
jgi:hypothetical protein